MTEYNAASRRHIREAEKAQKAFEQERAVVVASIMEHKGGRAWMLSILETCHIFSSSFTNNALSTAFKEGERNIGIKLLASIMQASPDNYILMMREEDERQRTAERRRSSNGNGRIEAESEQSRDDEGDDDNGVQTGPVGGNEVDYRESGR